MLVVTGGNGRLGRMIGGFLRDKIGTRFGVTTRDPAKAADLAAAGISVRAATIPTRHRWSAPSPAPRRCC